MTKPTLREAKELYALPLMELIHRASMVHRDHQPHNAVQLCTLLSVKTGACSEDCSYCPQSGHHDAKVGGEKIQPERLMSVDEVLGRAKLAKENGASRFCMGAAWRDARTGDSFDNILRMVRGVRSLDMEACCTLGMLTDEQANELAEAGLTAYNHNLDTSKEFYGEIITTRTFDERLATIDRVAKAGIAVCSGGIIGMGESDGDRLGMLVTLANLTPPPESVPINALVAVEGTPLAHRPPVDPLEIVRMCAVARILMPQSIVRLSAGRETMSREAQVLAFMAGANSIFYGEKLLITGNPDVEKDMKLFRDAGIEPLIPSDAETPPLSAPALMTSAPS